MSFISANGPTPATGAVDGGDPLKNLSVIQTRMDNLHNYLADSVNAQILLSQSKIDAVNAEISSAIHQVILNAAALLSPPPDPNPVQQKTPVCYQQNPIQPQKTEYDTSSCDADVVEIDAVELLAEHVHFCDICGKGFKRDANLRMHMRAHGNQFKTVEALTKPDKRVNNDDSIANRKGTRFSCPYVGCNRNKNHKKFRPLKSIVCVKNHFKRSHCPKMYSCNRCNKKSFSVVADLKSHLKHCGVSKWKCSCGTSFSRKDKLFGHVALFEGHMPAIVGDDKSCCDVDEEQKIDQSTEYDDGFFEGLENGFGSVDGGLSALEGLIGIDSHGIDNFFEF